MRIEDYAIIGDTHTAALVGLDGSVDWLCLPRFDSGALFASLLGDEENGRWKIAPVGDVTRVERRYRRDTLVLETTFHTSEGVVRLVDCMPLRDRELNLVRLVEGVSGRVPMRMDLTMRFDYGSIVPWVRRMDHGLLEAVAGPDAVDLRTPVPTEGRDFHTVADFSVEPGDRIPFVLTWFRSHEPVPEPVDPLMAIDATVDFWQAWASRCRYEGEYRDAVIRSLITLKALTYAPTGGIMAAPTTSLPERLGGSRNWDYRFCWLRDATFTLYSLLTAGYEQEAAAWRDWLLRAVAGKPSELQIVYGPAGERRLTEFDVPWLSGYERSGPVRIGNAAHQQFQLDVYGEVLDLLHQSSQAGMDHSGWTWELELKLLEFLESDWDRPDMGIWEVRGPRRHFTHSKVMAWVAMDRGIRDAERFAPDSPEIHRWRALRDRIHQEVCDQGFDAEKNAFVQFYGSKEIDASLLMVPLVGFLPPDDPRVRGTVEAVERELMLDGFVRRYAPDPQGSVDGMNEDEGAFLPCSFWLADNYAMSGRTDEAHRLFRQ
ncbi:MAG TPA: glycoside hydrolase family 15 protein, partial [Actinomycetota bacterium]|nr:glycoside hydrolase family 15 protein [Actinomycetota bacterium]